MLGCMMDKPLLISEIIKHAAKFHGDAVVSTREVDGSISQTSWYWIDKGARALAVAFAKYGNLNFGDRIATLAWNNHRHLKVWFAVSGSGMVVHTLNPRLSPQQLAFIVNDAQDRVLIFDRTFVQLVADIRDDLKSVERIICLGPHDSAIADALPGVTFLDDMIDMDASFEWPTFDERSPSALCYTSGTTGKPKGVLYSHRSTMLHSFMSVQPDFQCLSSRDTVMPVVPMFHVNAWGVPYSAAMVGANLVLPGPFLDGESLLEMIATCRVTVAFGVPTIWQNLLEAAEKNPGALATMTRTIVGGTAAPPKMIATFRDRFDCDLIHGWGMTETSPVATMNQVKGKHADWTPEKLFGLRVGQGRPTFGMDMRIVDEEGKAQPHDGKTQGRLQVRGYWVVETYFGMTDSALTPDGWFDTGDVATIDPDGYMVIRDRLKDIIKSGGEWISSVELENIAVSHPTVKFAAAIGARHDKWGERPILVVQPKAGATVIESEVLALCGKAVPKWQVPDRVVVVGEMPVNNSGKIVKQDLRDRYGDILLRVDD